MLRNNAPVGFQREAIQQHDGAWLLYHPKPLAGELLSSWLVRTARGNARKLHTFSHILWPGRQIWNRDVDWFSDPVIVSGLARLTRTPLAVAARTTLAHLEGRLFEEHRPNSRTVWVRSVEVWHRIHLGTGLQFCPLCLSSGAAPYFRLGWRLGFVCACPKHRVVLLERCPACLNPVNFHRLSFAKSLCTCWACDFDLRSASAPPASPVVLAIQSRLENTLRIGKARMGTYGWVQSARFFVILHQLMRIVGMGRAADALREELRKQAGVPLGAARKVKGGVGVERLDPQERHDLLHAAATLLDDWPHVFIATCAARRVWSSSVLRDLNDPPFALVDPVQRHLRRDFYVPNEAEVEAMRDYCRRRGVPPTARCLRLLSGRDSRSFAGRVVLGERR